MTATHARPDNVLAASFAKQIGKDGKSPDRCDPRMRLWHLRTLAQDYRRQLRRMPRRPAVVPTRRDTFLGQLVERDLAERATIATAAQSAAELADALEQEIIRQGIAPPRREPDDLQT